MSRLKLKSLVLLVTFAACRSDSSPVDPIDPGPNITSDTLPIVGHGLVTGRFTAEIAARDGWAYTTTWGNRGGQAGNAVFIWDVSGLVPLLTDSLIISQVSTIGDVQISDDGSLLVIATEFSPGSIIIYDRSDPARPVQLSRFSSDSTYHGVHTVKLAWVGGRHYAFLAIDPGVQPSRLVIVDITNPASPTSVWARTMGDPLVHDVFVRDGLLFTALWHGGVTIWDIGGGGRGGSPSSPVEIVNFQAIRGWIHNLWWFHDPSTSQKRYLFLGEEGPYSVGTNSTGDIHVFDISTLTRPRQVAHYTLTGAGPHNFWMDETSGILYAAYYNAGVRAIDVRGSLGGCSPSQRSAQDLCDLRRMGREAGVALTQGQFVWGVVHEGTHVYASDMLSGIYKIDVSTLAQ